MNNRFLRITYFASKVGVNLFLFIMINSFFNGNLFVFLTGLFWLLYSFSYYYEEEKRLEDLENVMEVKKWLLFFVSGKKEWEP